MWWHFNFCLACKSSSDGEKDSTHFINTQKPPRMLKKLVEKRDFHFHRTTSLVAFQFKFYSFSRPYLLLPLVLHAFARWYLKPVKSIECLKWSSGCSSDVLCVGLVWCKWGEQKRENWRWRRPTKPENSLQEFKRDRDLYLIKMQCNEDFSISLFIAFLLLVCTLFAPWEFRIRLRTVAGNDRESLEISRWIYELQKKRKFEFESTTITSKVAKLRFHFS